MQSLPEFIFQVRVLIRRKLIATRPQLPTLRACFCFAFSLAIVLWSGSVEGDEQREGLWKAVRGGDVEEVSRLLESGADVDSPNEIGITTLWLAASNGRLEVAERLMEQGADVNARDAIWYQTPLSASASANHVELVKSLINAGAENLDEVAFQAATTDRHEVLRLLLDTERIDRNTLDGALFASSDKPTITMMLREAGADSLSPVSTELRESWAPLAGSYENDNGRTITVQVHEFGLVVVPSTGPRTAYRATEHEHVLVPIGLPHASLRVETNGDAVQQIWLTRHTAETAYYPTRPEAPRAKELEEGEFRVKNPRPWPQFRGPDATGIGDGQHPPIHWDVATGTNVRWKTEIPGLGHSSPIVWGNRVFLTTAISGDPAPRIRTGNYGDVQSVDDLTTHTWHVLCLDRDTGEILWNKKVHEGIPKIKRHLKGSQANCTPATDGRFVVSCFGPEGLYCHDFEGNLIWNRDLSSIDSSFSIDKDYEWGFASSPIIHNELVIVQLDLSRDSMIVAYRLEDGSRVWATPRDEIPSWSTPVVWRNSHRTEIVTNASQYARSYDPRTGEELWRLDKKSEITVPTPVPDGDLLFISSGNRPIQPIFAIRPGAEGDISLPEGSRTSEHIAWSQLRGGPYMPTPIAYRGDLYVCSNAGIVTRYDASTGENAVRTRIGGQSYTASPIAADGRLYFVSEQGEVRVMRGGDDELELLAVNDMKEICMSVPAISNGLLFVRTQHHLYALGREETEHAVKQSGANSFDEKSNAVLRQLDDFLDSRQAPFSSLLDCEFAHVSLTKSAAEAAAQRLWEAKKKQILTGWREQFERKRLKWNDLEMNFEYRVFGERPERGHSLYISMHGGGNAAPAVNDRQWRNQIQLYQPEEGIYLAPRAPTNTWNLWHEAHIDPLFDQLIAILIALDKVDPDRIYLLGYSAGGDGVFQLAPRMADRFAAAAMMAGHPNETEPDGLRNLPFTLHMGGNDGAYRRNAEAEKWKGWLERLQQKDPGGYDHWVTIYPDKGHWMDGEDAAAIPWMAERTRNPWPRRVVWLQDDVTHRRFYWLAVRDEQLQARAKVVAEIEGQTIKLESRDVAEIDLLLHDRLVDLDRPLELLLNGHRETVQLQRTLAAIVASLELRQDPKLISTAHLVNLKLQPAEE